MLRSALPQVLQASLTRPKRWPTVANRWLRRRASMVIFEPHARHLKANRRSASGCAGGSRDSSDFRLKAKESSEVGELITESHSRTSCDSLCRIDTAPVYRSCAHVPIPRCPLATHCVASRAYIEVVPLQNISHALDRSGVLHENQCHVPSRASCGSCNCVWRWRGVNGNRQRLCGMGQAPFLVSGVGVRRAAQGAGMHITGGGVSTSRSSGVRLVRSMGRRRSILP